MARQARSSGDTVLVDTLETELRILELQKRLAAQLQVGMLLCDCLWWLGCLDVLFSTVSHMVPALQVGGKSMQRLLNLGRLS